MTHSRRSALRALGFGVLAIPLVKLTGCGDDTRATADAAATGDPDASLDPDASPGDTCGPAAAAWATGGTAAMTAKACYPDPFTANVASCAMICSTTLGPCTAVTPDRQDVSEGVNGLPVRLALKIVRDSDCSPVVGAKVTIWHTQKSGVYSGVTPSPQQCNGGDADAVNHNYFRGLQTTDATGRVNFDTCYPGWYPGRAIHIHVQVVIDATSYIVTQIAFSDALSRQVCTTHPEYASRGMPTTINGSDGVFRDIIDKAPYILDTARMSDGAMLASKVISIRASTATPACAT